MRGYISGILSSMDIFQGYKDLWIYFRDIKIYERIYFRDIKIYGYISGI